jgi:hypothetical protein
MKIHTIVNNNETSALMRLSSFPIWDQDVSNLNDYHLLGHYTQLKSSLGTFAAVELMGELKGECLLHLMLSDLPHCAIIDWRPPINDLIAPYLLQFMQSLTLMERACILVALAENAELSDIVALDWQSTKLNPYTPFSRKVINRTPQRLGCRFVFWSESVLGRPAPLDGLEGYIRHEMKVNWAEFKSVTSALLRFEHFAHGELDSLLYR